MAAGSQVASSPSTAEERAGAGASSRALYDLQTRAYRNERLRDRRRRSRTLLSTTLPRAHRGRSWSPVAGGVDLRRQATAAADAGFERPELGDAGPRAFVAQSRDGYRGVAHGDSDPRRHSGPGGEPEGIADHRGRVTAETSPWRPAIICSRSLSTDLAEIGDPRGSYELSPRPQKGLAAGELEQYRASGDTVELEAYLEHIRKKTAGLFKAACVAGGTLGGLSLRQIDALARYGQALGLAFQMSDDVMDLVGKPGLMGKGIGTDLVEGTVTLPVIFAIQEGDSQKIWEVLKTPHPEPELLEAGIEAVLATDAIEKTEAWARGEIDAAIDDLELLPDRAERTILEAIAAEVVGRDV